MAKPEKLEAYPEQDYPSLAEFTSRRGFLKRAVLTALAATAGGQLLSGCHLFGKTAGDMPGPDYHDVRLPVQGSSNVYMFEGDYLTFAVTFITYDQDVADFYNNDVDKGLDLVHQVLYPLNCAEVNDPERRAELEENLRFVLEEVYEVQTNSHSQGIAELTLLVEACEDGMMPGDIGPPPDIP